MSVETMSAAKEVSAGETARNSHENKGFDPDKRIDQGNAGEKISAEKYDPDKRVETDDKYKGCPETNGSWTGERGESKWIPDRENIPQKGNPENKTMGEILDKYGIDGIEFKKGEPNFNEVSKSDVSVSISPDRQKNFSEADKLEGKNRGCSPQEVKAWRKENNYTWHECSNMKTMQLVPQEIHANIPHYGGVSEAKKTEKG